MSSPLEIEIRGAREHNLQNVSLKIPKNKLIVMTGVSGSGKSSLAFDTLYAEGQRRYVESLSTYARQFLGQMSKPDVDSVTGIAPCISIQQKTAGRNPRSTVGTMTEIYDYLRVLFARVGQGYCYISGKPIQAQAPDNIVESILKLPEGTRFSILAPVVQNQKGEFKDFFKDLLKKGFMRVRVDGEIYQLNEPPNLQRHFKHNIEVIVDRLVSGSGIRSRLTEAVTVATALTDGLLIVSQENNKQFGGKIKEIAEQEQRLPEKNNERLYSTKYACPESGMSYDPPSPQLFSFNSPLGMCPDCLGLGVSRSFDLTLLIDENLSIEKGAIRLLGEFKGMGKWKRHLLQGVATAIEEDTHLKTNSFLSTTWSKLPEESKKLLLYGLGKRLITYTWKKGKTNWKHGGYYEGIIAEFLKDYRECQSAIRIKSYENLMHDSICPSCEGGRINKQARFVRIKTASESFRKTNREYELNLPQVCALTIDEAIDFLSKLELDEQGELIAGELLKEIQGRLGFLLRCGLDYLSLERQAPTLSGGESQRIRLAGQIGCGLVGVIYVLDEPSIGLHPRDNVRLLQSLCDLRDQGNTVIVVEHDEDTMRAADHVFDFGPGPGHRGGRIVAEGSVEDVMKSEESLTGKFLSRKETIEIPEVRKTGGDKKIVVKGATHHNLKNIDVEFPLERIICVTGVSGSGKSSLVNDILWQVLNNELNKGEGIPGNHHSILGLDYLDKAIDIDQSPIGRTPRSNPATYTKLFDLIRDLFSQLPASKMRGFKNGRFSFNVVGGRCEKCEGNGAMKLEMDFLADVWVPCPVCNGKRFNQETLEITFKNYNISQVLDLEVREALDVFEKVPKIRNLLQTLHDVGLDYLKLGQPSPTLSGGEAQRIKLARELGKRSTGKTVYLLDEPTTGLHFVDVRKLIDVMKNFVDQGNTVIVVEHHLDVIKASDYVIDMGLEGGAGGGRVIVAGTPEDVASHPESYTGHALAQLPDIQERLLNSRVEVTSTKTAKKKKSDKNASKQSTQAEVTPILSGLARRTPVAPVVSLKNDGHGRWQTVDDALAGKAKTHITIRGANQHNLQAVDVDLPRDKMLVFCGPSGSGKSSLAMDTIYAEGQRRYVESLSSYARQFLGQMPKPQVEQIRGLSPAIAIEQKTVTSSPRSTVGTVTEIYDYLRVLFARLGILHCVKCGDTVEQITPDQIVERILENKAGSRWLITAPVKFRKGEKVPDMWKRLQSQGFNRVRIDGATYTIDKLPRTTKKTSVEIEVVIDRISVSLKEKSRITDSVEQALNLGEGVMFVVQHEDGTDETQWKKERYSRHYACDRCNISYELLTPQNFSFNHPSGWCPDCEGLGQRHGSIAHLLINDENKTIRQGGIAALPDLGNHPLFRSMLEVVLANVETDLDTPLAKIKPEVLKYLIFGDRRNKIYSIPDSKVRFEWRGIYNSLDKASRVSYSHRQQYGSILERSTCTSCGGSRLRKDASHVRLKGKTIYELCLLPLEEAVRFLKNLNLNPREIKIAGELLAEATSRLDFMIEVGLEYLTLERAMPTLSGGESQRIRLASQLGRSLTGVLYVLDEPTIGLHPRDNNRLISSLNKLKNQGNTIILVEHDRDVIEAADNVYDFGPGSGNQGGIITAEGPLKEICNKVESLTGDYLSGKKGIPVPENRRMNRLISASTSIEKPAEEFRDTKQPAKTKNKVAEIQSARNGTIPPETEIQLPAHLPTHHEGWLRILGVSYNNLKNIDLNIPLKTMVCVTGVSGSGKSSLIMDSLGAALKNRYASWCESKFYDKLLGAGVVREIILVDQQPLGSTPASSPATYTGIWEKIREFYANLPEAKVRGFSGSRFSTNRAGGRCEDCEGVGQIRVEMHFLPDIWVECTTCRGKRFNLETLEVKFKGKSISDVLDMSVEEAHKHFYGFDKITHTLAVMNSLGLGYLKLGQSAPTLSGGEAQRIKLVAEFSRPHTTNNFYLLDEPTTGLHFDDIAKLIKVINGLVDRGNTVVVIEHNLDVIKIADWVIDMGPEAGAKGGFIVAEGTPEDVVEHAEKYHSESHLGHFRSYTGEMLKPILKSSQKVNRTKFSINTAVKESEIPQSNIPEKSIQIKSPWEVEGRKWHLYDRRSHTGLKCRWDGEILGWFLDELENYPELAAPNFNHRSVVEIKHQSKQGTWFLHALTGDEWLLTLNLRTTKKTITKPVLNKMFKMKPLDEINEIPRYNSGPRVFVEDIIGPMQEVTFKLYKKEEITQQQIATFIKAIIPNFLKYVDKLKKK